MPKLLGFSRSASEEAWAAGAPGKAATIALRKRKSRAIVIRVLRRSSRLQFHFDKAGLIGKAMNCLRNLRSTLLTFVHDGNVPIDNNACELAIRPIAVGRRNWLFAGSMRGGRAAAVIYTLIESCKEFGVAPVEYIADVLSRVGSQPADLSDELRPAAWAAVELSVPSETAAVV